jgi:hypothetical protein
MGCSVCANLERNYAVALGEYLEARSSACYGVSTKPAARKNVEMERARYELEEHQLVCNFAASSVPLAPSSVTPKRVPVRLRQVAA